MFILVYTVVILYSMTWFVRNIFYYYLLLTTSHGILVRPLGDSQEKCPQGAYGSAENKSDYFREKCVF